MRRYKKEIITIVIYLLKLISDDKYFCVKIEKNIKFMELKKCNKIEKIIKNTLPIKKNLKKSCI